MTGRILIIGGRGRIGKSVAADLIEHTSAEITISGRTSELEGVTQLEDRLQYLVLDLADQQSLKKAIKGDSLIAPVDLVIHCAGPFRYRDGNVLKICLEEGVNYLDVSDDRNFTKNALAERPAAQTAGITAVINTGVFPGISNNMALLGVEQLDTAEEVYLSYAVAGSGGAGVTAMRTTFLTLQHSFEAWLGGKWQEVKPYTDCEIVQFPHPFGKLSVCWFDMPEAFTLVDSFPVKTITTKFGVFPNFYNHLTWMTARWFPTALMQQPLVIESLSQISHRMTSISDRFSGTGVAVRVEVRGQKKGRNASYCSTLIDQDAAIATGRGTGSIAQLILNNQLTKPGVWTPEQILPTNLFEQAMLSRGLVIEQDWL